MENLELKIICRNQKNNITYAAGKESLNDCGYPNNCQKIKRYKENYTKRIDKEQSRTQHS